MHSFVASKNVKWRFFKILPMLYSHSCEFVAINLVCFCAQVTNNILTQWHCAVHCK